MTYTISENDAKKLKSWFGARQKEVIRYLEEGDFAAANIVSQHIAQYFLKNDAAKEITYYKHSLFYHAVTLRYTVLSHWLTQLSKDEKHLRFCFEKYATFFSQFRYGMNGITKIAGFPVPPMSKTVIDFIHVAEQINDDLIRVKTLKSLLAYLRNFAEKKVGKDSDAFQHEYIDKDTLQIVAGYQLYLQSAGIDRDRGEILERTVAKVQFGKLRQLYEEYITNQLYESEFYQFLCANESEIAHVGNEKLNKNIPLKIQISYQKSEGTKVEEPSHKAIMQFLAFEMREARGLDLVEDTKEVEDKWWDEKRLRLDFLSLARDPHPLSAEEQYKLGSMYLQGVGTEKNEKEAFRWMLAAAQQEHLKAMEMLVGLYYKMD